MLNSARQQVQCSSNDSNGMNGGHRGDEACTRDERISRGAHDTRDDQHTYKQLSELQLLVVKW